MATCQIWKVKNNLNNVINYINNKDKINENLYDDLHNELNYISSDSKTEEKLYVSGINCNVLSAYNEMMITKRQWNKTGSIIAFHAFQSFKENEVTPSLAHDIGIELANKMWGDRFQVVVATHLNTNNIHNHFVINSVSFVDGKRYYDNRASYARLRFLNDEICKEHGLSYLKEKKTRKGIDYTKYQNINYENYYHKTKNDIDNIILNSKSYDEFINSMKKNNYDVYIRSGKISVRHKDYHRSIRIERKFGKDYTIENIIKRIKGVYIPEVYYYNNYSKDKTLELLLKTNQKSLAYLYISYLKLLKRCSNSPKRNYLSYELKKEINKMDMISKEVELIVNNKIECEEDLHSFYLKLNKKDNYEEIVLCEDIIKRNNIKEKIENIEKEVIIR